MSDYDPGQLPDLLPIYYKRLFPFELFCKWLDYGGVKNGYFRNREFSFTLPEDIVVRYQSFISASEFEEEIKRRCPHKIDIGAVFNTSPKSYRHVTLLVPEEKELVLDIDMTDYDEVRTCCQGADVCARCWRFMAIAVQVLDQALRDDFGWLHLLWVFSGRRGVHCWVCDASARQMDQKQRSAVAEYLQVVVGGESQGKKVNLPGDRRAVEIIETQFETLVEEQDFFGSETKVQSLLAAVKDEGLCNEIKKALDKCPATSKHRWKEVVAVIAYQKSRGQLKWRTKNIKEELILQYAYPRLDINVSKGLNHLLKAPFCVHPKTGKICIPFNPKVVNNFSLTAVPTISSLINEIQEYDEKQDSVLNSEARQKMKDYKKTSMNKNITVFSEFLRKLEDTWRGKMIEISDEKMEF
ncbi:hypothetical protein LSTR_LSTR012339 [Laodelphax striatellus]|uniref:DNA primase n=1 Tax=Laodelphax striatellus TaxID=195883 RepID=A0A482X8F5_LAOST|nr:hypothetical protein LSTR_LSTR012339 [Laodelphax striatellus]